MYSRQGGERPEVGVEDHRGLAGGNVQPLAQAVGLHAVGQAVGDHLGGGPLLDAHRTGFDAEHLGGNGRVDILAGLEGLDQPGVLGQVGDAAQLDLVVVGHQQLAALGGHEHLSEHPTGLGAYRDVVQVGGVGAKPPQCGPPSD